MKEHYSWVPWHMNSHLLLSSVFFIYSILNKPQKYCNVKKKKLITQPYWILALMYICLYNNLSSHRLEKHNVNDVYLPFISNSRHNGASICQLYKYGRYHKSIMHFSQIKNRIYIRAFTVDVYQQSQTYLPCLPVAAGKAL